MENDPKAVKVAWIIWAIFIVGYIAMNVLALKSESFPKEKVVPGFGLAMPIICNLVWWAIGFRLRFRINHWWAFGILTSLIAGAVGFLTMLAVAKGL